MNKGKEIFENVKSLAEADKGVLGLILAGSRGKGLIHDKSDYDMYLVVKDDSLSASKAKYEVYEGTGADVRVFSLSEFKKIGITDFMWWDKYNFTHLKATFDKTGEIQKLIDEKAKIPKTDTTFIEWKLMDYINRIYRSIKCFSLGDELCGKAHAVHTLEPLFDAFYASHNRRVRPYWKYFKWELEKEPLDKLSISSEELVTLVKKIIESGDLESQQKLFGVCEDFYRKEGLNQLFDDWGKKLVWVRSVKL